MNVKENRELYLKELRSGKYKKGTMKSDDKGNPMFDNDEDAEGSCACAIMHDLFYKSSSRDYLDALNLNTKQCRYIQQELNDKGLSFSEIADRIESEIFY